MRFNVCIICLVIHVYLQTMTLFVICSKLFETNYLIICLIKLVAYKSGLFVATHPSGTTIEF